MVVQLNIFSLFGGAVLENILVHVPRVMTGSYHIQSLYFRAIFLDAYAANFYGFF